VENFLLKLFVQLFGGSETLATNIYLSLGNQSAKTAAINAAVESVFQPESDEANVFKAIMSIAKTNEKDRNKLAHWTWGDSPNLNDAVLLVDPRATILDLDPSKVFVYKANDFMAIIEENNKLCGYGQLLKFVLTNHVANSNGELIEKLLSEPEIKARLPR
jgi:hypothetical protein